MTIQDDCRKGRGSASKHGTGPRQHVNTSTSQAEPSSHPTQNIPNHPLLIQLIVVQYLQSRIDNRVSEDRAFRSLGKYLGGVRCRGSPYRKEE